MTTPERSLAAIMFTDIVGYTKLAQADEALSLELLEEHREVVRPVLAVHGGKEVKTMGDAFLVEFRSALEAVLCAVEIQEKMATRNAGAEAERKITMRIGIHLGDVVHGAGDVYGDAVNVASRIYPLAVPGGICISQQVYDNIRNKTELDLSMLGKVELKNVSLPVGVYRVNMSTRNADARAEPAPRERLAVLPFVNISPDPNDEYFADGLTEELITKLSEVRGLKVIARTSVMNYKKKEKSVSEIGRELEVGSIIEGSVRKSGNRIRVTVQLIDPRTEEHLWASNYDKELDDIFAIQSDVATRVASSVSSGAFLKLGGRDTEDIEAYTLYIKAVQLSHDTSEPGLKQARDLLEKTIGRDPKFARAYAALAGVLSKMSTSGYLDYTVTSDAAVPAAKKALELDPGSADAHSALSWTYWVLDRFAESVSEAEAAISINPNLAEAHESLSVVYGTMGRLDEAYAAGRKALELDPLNEGTAVHFTLLLMTTGRMDEALPMIEKMNVINPKSPRVHNKFVEYYLLRGELDKAQNWLTSGLALNPHDPLLRMNQGLLYVLAGRRKEAESVLNEIDGEKFESVRLYGKLFLFAAMGNLDEAFKVLDRTAELHSWPAMIPFHPLFAELRKDPRWVGFCKKVGLPVN